MLLHDKAFYICAFFLLGVFLFSIFKSIAIIVLISAIGAVYFLTLKQYKWLWFLPGIIFGAFYYSLFSKIQERISIPFGNNSVEGIVIDVDHRSASQGIALALSAPNSGKIKLTDKPYPRIEYGDQLSVSGNIEKIAPEMADSYAKDGIYGTAKFAKINILAHGRGNWLMSGLISFREKIVAIFSRVLPSDESALLAGITLGEREGFSDEFKEKMSLSGTTHIVALSGYNISIIALVITNILIAFVSRSAAFYLTSLAIILFVAMTGAEASAVRAAIMGILALLAQETQRQFSMRNAIVIAAFGMVLLNPRVLVFDLGFQLSFAALIGIVYLLPILKYFIKTDQPGLLSWRENGLTTLSAQLAVFPLLLGKFGVVSVTSILANILILEAMPITMALGFVIAGTGFISVFLAQIIAFTAYILLTYELWVIGVFSRLSIPLSAPWFGFTAAIIYYSVLAFVIIYYGPRFVGKNKKHV